MAFGDELLAQPDLFPARRAGEPWGDRDAALELGGAAFRFRGLSPAQAAEAEKRLGAAPAAGPADAVETRVFRVPPADFLPFPVGREYRLDLDPGPSRVRLAGLGFMGLVERREGDGGGWTGALFTDSEHPDRFPDVLENYLRPLAALHLLEARTLLVHSAALLDRDGRAWLFPGRSGAGKSTLSALAERAGLRVLSDELNALVVGADDVHLLQVPFEGDRGRPRIAGPQPLRAVGRLRHAATDGLAAIGPGETLALAYAALPYLNRDPHRGPRAEALLAELVARVPCYELAFGLGSDLAVLAASRPA